MLEKVKHYLLNNYPDTMWIKNYQEIVQELTKTIEENSMSFVIKEIRKDGIPCPLIVKLADTGQYTFHKCAKKVVLDFDEAYISNDGFINGFKDFKRGGYREGSLLVMVSDNHPKYDGIYLFSLIALGEECEDCGKIFIDYDNVSVCDDCATAYKTLEYNAKAEDILPTEETSSRLFGIELEYEDITARQVGKTLKGHAISKRDGSIRNGVEVVTRPACVETHKKSLKPFYESVKVSAKSNTGMHVHVDKKNLSAYQLGFMLEFLNKPSLIPDIEKVAGRKYSTNTYCRTLDSMKMSWGNKFDEGRYKLVKTPTQKYSPLNTSKAKTIEVRIFSSPESYEEMCGKLDFVAALVRYSSPYAVSVKSLKEKFEWATFTNFVEANRKEFPHFVSYFLKG